MAKYYRISIGTICIINFISMRQARNDEVFHRGFNNQIEPIIHNSQ